MTAQRNSEVVLLLPKYLKKAESRKNSIKIAVASKTGLLIDEHFGHAEELYIYEYSMGKINYLEKRKLEKYCTGAEECDDEKSKIDRIISAISDCKAVLVLRIGYNPSKILADKGIQSIQTCGRIEEAIKMAVSQMENAKELLETVVC